MSVTVQFCLTTTTNMDGGCHVILLRCRTGEEHLAMVSAHAGWLTRVQTPVMAVTVTRMTMYGVKTAVSSLTRPSFLWYKSGLEILVKAANKVTIPSENWSALGQHKWRLLFQSKKARVVCSVISSKKQVIVQSWTKVLGYFCVSGALSNLHSPTPPLTPQTMLDACIQNVFV